MPTRRSLTMKRMLIPVATVLLLSACTGITPQADTRLEAQERASQLALGTVGLEGTNQAVDAAAAAQLLPMWELLSDLGTSSTAAPEELAATVQAIEAAMSAEQLAAIDAMDLSAAEMSTAGRAEGAPFAAESNGSAARIQPAAMDPELGGDPAEVMGAGMPMDGGMPPAGGSSQSPGNTPMGGNSSAGMYRNVIALLQSKLQD